MTISKTVLANLALTHLGVGDEIANIDTEKSAAGKAMRAYFDIALKKLFSEHEWSFTTRYINLALVSEEPNAEFCNAYRVPTNVVRIQKVISGTRNETRQSLAVYHMGADSDGRLLYCDLYECNVKATVFDENMDEWPPEFIMAFTYYLAYLTAARITKEDPFQIRNTMFELFNLELGKAKSHDLNESIRDEEPVSEFERVRL